MKKNFTIKEIKDFVHEHIQEEINSGMLVNKGFSENDSECFEREFNLYRLGLCEGLINGITMMGGSVVDLEFRSVDK